ncbi:hypothetical protein BDR07DRAFT_1398378 [Suillus spraguei]|nr:hypothetical protein BDR07DRAFT_1398378 [Suillus spraguei]
MGQTPSQFMEDMQKRSNFTSAELERLKKRFMKLDRVLGGTVDFQEFVGGLSAFSIAFKVYDVDSRWFYFQWRTVLVLKMMDQQLQQIVDKTIMEGDLDHDGKLSFRRDIVKQMTLEDLF